MSIELSESRFKEVTGLFDIDLTLPSIPRNLDSRQKTSKEEKQYIFETGDIDKEEDEFSEIYLGKTAFTVPESEFNNGVAVTVEWPFRGTYSDKEIDVIKAEGKIGPN